MAITVIQRPQGHKLDSTLHTATASNDSGDVLFTTTSNHGLSDGDYAYIESNIESYNGFKYVDSTGYTTFKIKDGVNSAYTEFKQAVEIDFMVSIMDHGFQCVHLPIVYELASDLFPFNELAESYTPNTIMSFSNYAGNVRLNTQNYISDPIALLKIELLGTGPLAGVYQITNVFTGSDFVIDLAYDADYDFDDYTIVKYYDNYAITVNIYAGLNTDHPWYSEKPIGLVATKKFIPDENNRVKFSIDEILRGFIITRNNLALDTLPNNTDFLCEFYIGYFQSWDVVEDGELINQSDDETIDSFVGQAINAKNEFKDLYSGYLSDYVSNESSLARWLTDFEEPIAIVDYFFDISFLNSLNGVDIQVTINKMVSSYIASSEILIFDNPGVGILRVPITAESGYDYYCITAATPGSAEIVNSMDIEDLSEYINSSILGRVDWTLGASPTVTLPGAFPTVSTSQYLYKEFPFVTGREYTITVNYTWTLNSGSSNPRTSLLAIRDDAFTTIFSETDSASAGANVMSITFVATPGCVMFTFHHQSGSNVTLEIDSIEGTETIEAVESQTITEEICIKILEECSDTFNGEARLTQDGGLRLLE
jgi:hypothetical protein